MSLLTVVQQAFGEIGLAPPSSVATNTDANVIKAFALANRAGIVLRNTPNASDYWPVLRKQFLFNLFGIGPFAGTFTNGSNVITAITGTNLAGVQPGWQISSTYALNDTMVVSVNAGAGTVTMTQNANVAANQSPQRDTQLAFGQEAYPQPADLNYFIPQTGWDRNFRWQLLGPVDAQEWQVLKSGISPVGPRLRYRLMAGQIYMNPAPYVPTGQSSPISDLIVMEYASNQWVAVTGAPTVGAQTAYVLDSDVSVIPEDLITLSLKWRMLKAIGTVWADEFTEYQDELDKLAGRFQMARNLPLNARASGIRLLNSQNVPDTGFGS
jgi:hypothetical protein